MNTTWREKIYDILFKPSQHEDLIAYPGLPLTGSLFSVMLFDIAYLGFVLKIGPRLMRKREPFQLKTVIMIYNALQVIINATLLITAVYFVFFTDVYEMGCMRRLPVGHPVKTIEIATIYTGYLLRYLDYLDTIFFVLRKSYRQLTFLHVYHHVAVTFLSYYYIRDIGFGGHGMFSAFFNTFVHMCMYAYYFVSASKPELKNSVWWKRHITELQIVQFLIILIHQSWPILVRVDCDFPKRWLIATISQPSIFLYLFIKFYVKTYLRKKTNEKANGNHAANGYDKKIKVT